MGSQIKTNLPNKLINIINISLIILVITLLSRALFISEKQFMALIAIYILFALFIFNTPLKKTYQKIIKKNLKTISGIILLITSFFILIYFNNLIIWLSSIPLFLSGLKIILENLEIKRKELEISTIFTFIYTIIFILVKTIPILWYTLQQLSLHITRQIGVLTNKSFQLGPSTSGLWITLVFLTYSFTIFFKKIERKNLKKDILKLLLNILGILVILFIYLVFLNLTDFSNKSDIISYHPLFFILLLIPTFIYQYTTNISYKKTKKSLIKKRGFLKNISIYSLIFLLLSIYLITIFPGYNNQNENNETILFYGNNMLGKFDFPEYGKYEEQNSGMFGLLPYYLNKTGYDIQIAVKNKTDFIQRNFPTYQNNQTNITYLRSINFSNYASLVETENVTSKLLKNIDIFVVISINKTFSNNEHNAIWDFIKNGGSLLVLGDHTDINNIKNPLNNLLKPVDISYKFDSAIPIDTNFEWTPCYEILNNPILYRLESLNEIQISVGASLKITSKSSPLIVGKYALSDKGNYSNVNYSNLGDYSYNPGEQLGDVILAAGSYHGQGKVMVFGDTSSFQNIALPHSIGFVKGVFNYLKNTEAKNIENLKIIFSIIFLALFALLYKWSSKKINFFWFPLFLCIILVLSISTNAILLNQNMLEGNILIVDTCHNERFNQIPFEENSLTGTMINFMRNDYLPLILREFNQEQIKNSEILLLNTPTKKISEDEVNQIKKYIKNGGLVILTTGYNDKKASINLLEEFGLDIYEIPLGPVPYVEENPEEYQSKPRFVDAWPIQIEDDQKTEVFYNVQIGEENYNLVTFTPYKNGGIILISDSQFLYDKNIETTYNYWPGNIQFLKNIIDEMKNRGVLEK